jgi:hypothetical protein
MLKAFVEACRQLLEDVRSFATEKRLAFFGGLVAEAACGDSPRSAFRSTSPSGTVGQWGFDGHGRTQTGTDCVDDSVVMRFALKRTSDG